MIKIEKKNRCEAEEKEKKGSRIEILFWAGVRGSEEAVMCGRSRVFEQDRMILGNLPMKLLPLRRRFLRLYDKSNSMGRRR